MDRFRGGESRRGYVEREEWAYRRCFVPSGGAMYHPRAFRRHAAKVSASSRRRVECADQVKARRR